MAGQLLWYLPNIPTGCCGKQTSLSNIGYNGCFFNYLLHLFKVSLDTANQVFSHSRQLDYNVRKRQDRFMHVRNGASLFSNAVVSRTPNVETKDTTIAF